MAAPRTDRAVVARTHLPIGNGWEFWRPAVVRAPGFPAGTVSRLASPAGARAADEVLAGARAAEEPKGADASGWPAYRTVYADESIRLGEVIQELAGDRRFQLALGWQNRNVLDTALPSLLRRRVAIRGRNTDHRQREEVVARYLQRYCVKNETIGFFGPVAWARLDPDSPTVVRPGERLVASSEVFFEAWAMDRLADAVAALPGMAAWLAPKRLPFVRFDGRRAYLPSRPVIELDPLEAETLRRCDGATPARDIAAAVAAVVGPADEAEVFAVLDRLRRRRLLVWKLELPVTPWPELDLRQFLDSVGDRSLAAEARAALDRLEVSRERVQRAAGDAEPTRLVAALRAVDEVFEEVTGASATRNGGQVYGSRTPVYHDTRRDIELTFGADVLAALSPVDLPLASVRWLTWQIGAALRQVLLATFSRLSQRGGPGPVDLAGYWFECLPVMRREAARIVAEVQAELGRRWAAILACPPDQPRVRYTASALRDRVLSEFAAPSSGWEAARYCSPDVMIAADHPAALPRGDFELVMGEFHVALNSCRHFLFFTQHPDPDELFACLRRDFPEPRLLPVLPKENPGRLTARTHPALVRDEDVLLAITHHSVDPHRGNVVCAADATVEAEDGVVRTVLPDGRRFDVLDVFAELLMDLVVNSFDLFAGQPHAPRVSIDKVVICRESWSFHPGELSFAAERDEATRFVEARRWWRQAGLPRWVFVKLPDELKPVYVDIDSPVYVNVLARFLRRSLASGRDDPDCRVRFTEMLPTPDQLWLTDAAGDRYTSELRVVAVDTRPVIATVGARP